MLSMESVSDSRRRANQLGKSKEMRIRAQRPDSDSDTSRLSSRPSRQAAQNTEEPRSRIIRNDNGEIVEYRYENGDSYKVEKSTSKAVKRDSGSLFPTHPLHPLIYKVNEATYIQTQRSDVPYLITKITDIKVTKAGHAGFVTRPFHRVDDLPYHIYQKLHHERQAEFKDNKQILQKLEQNSFTKRELFICDAEDIQREIVTQNQMRYHCRILYFKCLEDAIERFDDTEEDTFFYILGFNPQKRVIACQDKEHERVRQIHHWTAAERGLFNATKFLPDLRPFKTYTPEEVEAGDNEYETLTWKPNVAENDLIMYLRAARSMAAFAGMCHGGPTDACVTATRDATTLNAIDILTQCNGKVDLALEKLCQNPMPIIPQRMWCDEDTKAFIKGLKHYGKDFFYICKEFLPHKSTEELIEFYYLWKKTPEGLQSRAGYRRAPKRSMYNSKMIREHSDNELSEDDNNSIDSQIQDHVCRNCYTNQSNDWHHGGQSNIMLCGECRLHYKKYGYDKNIENRPATPPELAKLREEIRKKENIENELQIKQEQSEEIIQSIPVDDTKSEPDIKKEDEFKPEFKQEYKYEYSSTEIVSPLVNQDEIKRKQQNESIEEQPAIKKPKHETEETNTNYSPIEEKPTTQAQAQPISHQALVSPTSQIAPHVPGHQPIPQETVVHSSPTITQHQPIQQVQPSAQQQLPQRSSQHTSSPSVLPHPEISTHKVPQSSSQVTILAIGGLSGPGSTTPTFSTTAANEVAQTKTITANTTVPNSSISQHSIKYGNVENFPVLSHGAKMQGDNHSKIADNQSIRHLIQSPGLPGMIPNQNHTPPIQKHTSPQRNSTHTSEQKIGHPAIPEVRLGQAKPGAELAPRPEPDDDHPCGPFDPPKVRSPPPIRTSVKYQSNHAAKARFVRNWEYQDGNSCARTDLLFCKEAEEPAPVRRPPTIQQPTPSRTVPQPPPQRQQRGNEHLLRQSRPPRNNSNGSIVSSHHEYPNRRPPSVSADNNRRVQHPTGRITPGGTSSRGVFAHQPRPSMSPGQYGSGIAADLISRQIITSSASGLPLSDPHHLLAQQYLNHQLDLQRLSAQHHLVLERDSLERRHLIPGHMNMQSPGPQLGMNMLDQRLLQDDLARRSAIEASRSGLLLNHNPINDQALLRLRNEGPIPEHATLFRLQQERSLHEAALIRSSQFIQGTFNPQYLQDPRIYRQLQPPPK